MAPTLLLSLEQVWLNLIFYSTLELSKIIYEGNNEINSRKKSDTNQTDNEEIKNKPETNKAINDNDLSVHEYLNKNQNLDEQEKWETRN